VSYPRGIFNHGRPLGSLPAPDTGKSSMCPIRFRRLLAAVVPLSATKQLRKRSHADCRLLVRDANARLIPSRESAAAIHPSQPRHDLSSLQDRPALIAMIMYARCTRKKLRLSRMMAARIGYIRKRWIDICLPTRGSVAAFAACRRPRINRCAASRHHLTSSQASPPMRGIQRGTETPVK